MKEYQIEHQILVNIPMQTGCRSKFDGLRNLSISGETKQSKVLYLICTCVINFEFRDLTFIIGGLGTRSKVNEKFMRFKRGPSGDSTKKLCDNSLIINA